MTLRTYRERMYIACKGLDLWPSEIDSGTILNREEILVGVRPTVYQPHGTGQDERAFEIQEGTNVRRVPITVFNVLQATHNHPQVIQDIFVDEYPGKGDEDEFEKLKNMPVGTNEWRRQLCRAWSDISVKKDGDYGKRNWFQPWNKANDLNPNLRQFGLKVNHPGKDAPDAEDEDDEPYEPSENIRSAAGNW